MVDFFEDLADFVLVILTMVVLANLAFALLKPVVARFSGSQEYGEGHRSADGLLIVFPLVLLAVGSLSYVAVIWGFRMITLIAP